MDDWTLCEPHFLPSCFEERFLALYDLQQQGWLCDVEIVCEDGHIPAHKIILAVTSTYFKHMFSCSMKESTSSEVKMTGIRCDTFAAIIKYLYTNELDVTRDNALEVLEAANLLCLRRVEEACCEALLGPISKTSALEYALIAERYSITELLGNSIRFLVKECKYFSTNGSYNKLDIRAFTMLIESDDLDVEEESQVFDIVVEWVEHDPVTRSEHFKTLLEHVRLPLLPPGYLVDIVAKSEYVKSDLSCRDLVDEAKNRHLLPKRTLGYLSERMTPRKSTVGYIFLIGGLTVKEKLLSSVERYDLPLQQSFAMPDMSLARSGLGCAILDKVLYVIGGHDGTKSLKIAECLDFGKGSWTWVPQLSVPRRNLGVCANTTCLYAVGGQVDSSTTLASMEMYDPRCAKWQCLDGTMQQPRKYADVAYFNNSVYVVGGNDGTRYLHSCERYDMRAGRWESVAPLPHAFGANGLAVWNDSLTTVGGFDSRQCLDVSYLYDPITDTWSLLPATLSCRRTGLGTVTAGHRLYSLAGHSGETYLDTVEVYDSEAKMWCPLAPLHYKRGAMGVAVLENCYMTQPEPL